MKHPFWILNSALLILLVLVAGIIFITRRSLPARDDIDIVIPDRPLTRASSRINISKIYQDDLFGTYLTPPVPVETPEQLMPFPEPPTPRIVKMPEPLKPQFLDPLPITLRGIIMVMGDDTKNRAIVSDNATNVERSYKVGDKIDDAQLVRVFSNKVLFIRSNGQQEVLFLREGDANTDPSYARIDEWDEVVTQLGPNQFEINVPEFIGRVNSLAQFIDMLNITTVYQRGKSIGCRIGQISSKSLGASLGFEQGDIITKVNGITTADSSNRFDIYKNIEGLKTDETIKVEFKRNDDAIIFNYIIVIPKKEVEELGQAPTKSPEQIYKEQLELLNKKYKFAPTIQDIRKRDKQLMFEQGKASSKAPPSVTE